MVSLSAAGGLANDPRNLDSLLMVGLFSEAARAAASSASSFLASIAQWPFVFFRLFL